MATFKDTNGDQWQVEFDGFLLDEVLTETGVDLGEQSGSGLAAIAKSPTVMIKALIVLCREQWKREELTAREFSKRIRGAVIDAASDAVLQAAADFFPPSRWSEIQSLLKLAAETEAAWATAAPIIEKLQDPNIPEDFKAGMMQAFKEGIQASSSPDLTTRVSASGQGSTQATPATNSPANAESAPEGSP